MLNHKVKPLLLIESIDMYNIVISHIESVIRAFEDEESYEACAYYKFLQDDLKDYVLGYEKQRELVHMYMYIVCKMHGELIEVLKDFDEYIAVFKMRGCYFQFEIFSSEEWRELAKKLKQADLK